VTTTGSGAVCLGTGKKVLASGGPTGLVSTGNQSLTGSMMLVWMGGKGSGGQGPGRGMIVGSELAEHRPVGTVPWAVTGTTEVPQSVYCAM
jgi:hypothetical protein